MAQATTINEGQAAGRDGKSAMINVNGEWMTEDALNAKMKVLADARPITWNNAILLTILHAIAIAGAVTMFSWDGLWLSLILLFTISPVGVTFCYHRMLSHKAFKVPKWLEYTAALIGGLSAQGPIRSWVAAHRIHHRYSDMPGDLHSPRGKGFWFSHMVHLFYDDPRMHDEKIWSKYTPDLNNQKFYLFMDKAWWLVAMSILPVLYYFGGWTYVMWGGPIRVILMLHLTWFVNSATHAWGYRTYPTRDLSRNNWWVGILAAGEGWHNNHHAQANSARHGQRWYEIDVTWYLIWTLEKLGLAWDVKRPRPYVQATSEREDELALGQGVSQ